MKKFQFLLLDAGPIIGLFELGLWDSFLAKCDVTISRIVADEAKYASRELEDVRIDLEPYEQKGLLEIIDIDSSRVETFLAKFSQGYKDSIHPGEQEIFTFLEGSSENWQLCSTDGAVFKVLALLNRSDQGISLEEILRQIGLSQKNLDWKYTKRFREKYIQIGQTDAIQGKGLK